MKLWDDSCSVCILSALQSLCFLPWKRILILANIVFLKNVLCKFFKTPVWIVIFLSLFLVGHWGKGRVLVWGLRKVVEIHSSWKLARVLSLQVKLVIFPCRLRKKNELGCAYCRGMQRKRTARKRQKKQNVCMIYGNFATSNQPSEVTCCHEMKKKTQQTNK